MNKNKGEIIKGFSAFIVTIIFLIFIATPIQSKMGMYGVAVTEIIIAVIAMGFAFTRRQKLNEIFKFKRPNLHQLAGGFLLYGGAYFFVIAVVILQTSFFPQMIDTQQDLGDVFTSVPGVVSFIIIAIMPAICEEVLHRGYILSTLKNVNRDWIKILIMGVLFGIFHLDPYRFLVTMILGIVLTYMAIKANTIILPIIFHFINNTISVIASFSIYAVKTNEVSTFSNVSIFTIMGIGLIYIGIGLILLNLGWRVFNKRKSGSIIKEYRWITNIVILLFIITGFTLTSLQTNINVEKKIFETNFTCGGEFSNVFDFDVDESGTFHLDISTKNSRTDLRIIDEYGKTLLMKIEEGTYTYSNDVFLEQGHYLLDLKLTAVGGNIASYYIKIIE